MRVSLRLFSLFSVIIVLVVLNACSSTKKVVSSSDPLVGIWLLDSATVNGTTIPATMLGGDVTITFKANGKADFVTPDGKSETINYESKDGKIYNLDMPEETPIDIISLEASNLVLRMVEIEGPVLMMMSRK